MSLNYDKMNIKTIARVVLILLLFSSEDTMAQVYKFRAYESVLWDKTGLGETNKNIDILVVLNTVKHKMDIYANKDSHIDIIDYSDTRINSDGYKVNDIRGVDEDGVEVGITMVFDTTQKIVIAAYEYTKSKTGWIYKMRMIN